MQPRLNIAQLAPELYRAVAQLDGAVKKSGLGSRLLHLVKLRASQINGCAFCVDMHVKESLADGLDRLCCTNRVRDSSRESSVVA
ncbi:carboxymuconolactone decarboxylase family protein [Ruixingdingia sedimenti]|uniref:Carboxymuconolactone decarboxylase family protein n=1 Tax=Ruixingdingia sedimenti TaxID=3073604 RepID=A0ABU1FF50_9RHOB|nr:carboxymuconolactone decarboxylase family protein [Xinfangfangia sp. LG-4]MDR5655530.1 carboxymuconolactone decarboxylase family protein [Xinfangfangia sp. LG-4]